MVLTNHLIYRNWINCKFRNGVIISLVTLLFFCMNEMNGQSYFQGSLQSQNGYIDNVAFAGIFQQDIINLSYRNQWTGLNRAPSWVSANGSMPLYSGHGGVGFSVDQLSLGLEKNTSVQASYNYIYALGEGVISAGFSIGIKQKQLDGDGIRTPNGEYKNQVIDHQDAILPLDLRSSVRPMMGGGVYYVGPWGVMGLAYKSQLLQGYQFVEGRQVSEGGVMIASYKQKLNYLGMEWIPEWRLKTDFIQMQMEGGVMMSWGNNIYLGTALRGYSKLSLDALILKGGVLVNYYLSFYYAYDYSLSGLSPYSGFVHELLMTVRINHPNKAVFKHRRIYNSRML